MFIREDIEQEFASILSLMPQGDSKTTIEKLADKYRAGTVTSEDLVPAALVYDLLGENVRVEHDKALVVEDQWLARRIRMLALRITLDGGLEAPLNIASPATKPAAKSRRI